MSGTCAAVEPEQGWVGLRPCAPTQSSGSSSSSSVQSLAAPRGPGTIEAPPSLRASALRPQPSRLRRSCRAPSAQRPVPVRPRLPAARAARFCRACLPPEPPSGHLLFPAPGSPQFWLLGSGRRCSGSPGCALLPGAAAPSFRRQRVSSSTLQPRHPPASVCAETATRAVLRRG